MNYDNWLINLEKFKNASKQCTFEGPNIKIHPGDGTKKTVEIIVGTQRIQVDEEQSHLIINSLKELFPFR